MQCTALVFLISLNTLAYIRSNFPNSYLTQFNNYCYETPVQPPAMSFDNMPLPTANRNTYGFSQIAQRSKGSSICFGSEVKADKIHLFCMGSITVLMTGLNST